jgi:hypothetical protein
MNEKIKELLNEATSGLEPDLSLQRTVTLNEMQKFAELILQEIIEELEADVIDMDDDPTDYERGYDDGVKNSVAHIKDHFGVEE